MAAPPLRIEPGELTADEVIELLRDGRRLVIELELLGSPTDVVLRYSDGVFYCDTPTALHRHRSVEAMRQCIDEQGYASPSR